LVSSVRPDFDAAVFEEAQSFGRARHEGLHARAVCLAAGEKFQVAADRLRVVVLAIRLR